MKYILWLACAVPAAILMISQYKKPCCSNVAIGDEIVTIGGVTGKIVAIDGNIIVFETQDRVRIQVTKEVIKARL